jgi:hypothetical protein
MPKRDAAGDTPDNQQTGAGDAWDTVMEMKSASLTKMAEDANGFNKLNTNFYLMDGEEADIMLLAEAPQVFAGHNLKLISKAKKAYFVVEACQKSKQGHCVLCDSKSAMVGQPRQYIAFPMIDSRGKWDTPKKAFDGKPTAKIFLMPLGLAKGFKKLKDDAGGTLLDKIVKLTKDAKNYMPTIRMIKNPNDANSMIYAPAIKWTDPVPNISVIYAPADDAALNQLLNYMPSDDSGAAAGGQEEQSSSLFAKS